MRLNLFLLIKISFTLLIANHSAFAQRSHALDSAYTKFYNQLYTVLCTSTMSKDRQCDSVMQFSDFNRDKFYKTKGDSTFPVNMLINIHSTCSFPVNDTIYFCKHLFIYTYASYFNVPKDSFWLYCTQVIFDMAELYVRKMRQAETAPNVVYHDFKQFAKLSGQISYPFMKKFREEEASFWSYALYAHKQDNGFELIKVYHKKITDDLEEYKQWRNLIYMTYLDMESK